MHISICVVKLGDYRAPLSPITRQAWIIHEALLFDRSISSKRHNILLYDTWQLSKPYIMYQIIRNLNSTNTYWLFSQIFVVVSQCLLCSHLYEICDNAGFAVAVGIAGCHNDKLRCRQWWDSWHCGSSRFSVFVHLFKGLYGSNQIVCEIS